jgi:segregation and condensation protein B
VDINELKGVIEALLFVAGEPLSLDRIKNVLEDIDRRTVQSAIWEIQHEYEMRLSGLKIVEVAGGYQIATRPELAQWIKRLKKVKLSSRLSRPSLETLSIIAYKQPIVKAEVEDIRGVDSTGVIKGLLDKHLIKIIGRKDVPGRPILYATTKEFLQYFGLRDISDLPTLKEFTDLVEGEEVGNAESGVQRLQSLQNPECEVQSAEMEEKEDADTLRTQGN